ncbi:hypothetical protein MY3296_000251 [Beauveria thailandica]
MADSGEPAAVEDAVERERRRCLTTAEMKAALDDVQKLGMHEDAKEQLEEVRELLKPLSSDDAQDGIHSPLLYGAGVVPSPLTGNSAGRISSWNMRWDSAALSLYEDRSGGGGMVDFNF